MQLDEENIDYYQHFFGDHSDYWTQEAVQLEMQGRTRFNFYAFLFSVAWFLYRKMYRESLIVLMILFAISWIQDLIYSQGQLSQEQFILMNMVVTIIVSIILGILANRLYIQHCNRKVAEILAENSEEDHRVHGLKARGGTNLALAVVLMVALFILNLFG